MISICFAPSSPLESAILITLPPGAYTAIVTSAGGGVTAPIVGPQTVADLESLADAASLRLTPEDVKALEAPYRPKRVLGHF